MRPGRDGYGIRRSKTVKGKPKKQCAIREKGGHQLYVQKTLDGPLSENCFLADASLNREASLHFPIGEVRDYREERWILRSVYAAAGRMTERRKEVSFYGLK